MKESDFLPRILFDSKYRIWRHLILCVAGAIITSNIVFVAYEDCRAVLGMHILLICAVSFVAYMAAIYFNYFCLTPKFLLRGRYVTYAIALCVIVFLVSTLSIAGEYWVRNMLDLSHRVTSYTNPLILVDSLSGTIITAICFCGISSTMLLRRWIQGNEQINRMEVEHTKSEINRLKGEIDPTFLSKTLREVSALAESDPQRASDMLMQLAQLLRYKLYGIYRNEKG